MPETISALGLRETDVMARHVAELPRAVHSNRWDAMRAPEIGAWEPHRRVTVVIPHYEAQADLDRVLRGLALQTYPRELLDVIVTDDGSAVSPTIPDDHPLQIAVVVQAREGFGAGRARNTGARAASGELLVFLDGDTVPEPSFVESVARWLHLTPDAFVIGHRRYADLEEISLEELERALSATDTAAALGSRVLADPEWSRQLHSLTRDLTRESPDLWRTTISSVLACRAALFEELGGFDERFREWGGEDVELGFRAYNAGAVMIHDRHAVAWHNGEASGVHADKRVGLQRSSLQLASLVPSDRYRAPGAVYPAPKVVVEIDVEGLDELSANACILSWLSGSERDVAVVVRADDARRHDLGRPWASETRVRFDSLPADAMRRALVLVTLRHPLVAEPDSLERLVAEATPPTGVGIVDVMVDDAVVATVARTRALARAKRWVEDEQDPVDLAGELFGHRSIPAHRLGLQPATPDEAVDVLEVQQRFVEWDRANRDFDWLLIEAILRRVGGRRGAAVAMGVRRAVRRARRLAGSARHSSAPHVARELAKRVRASGPGNTLATRAEAMQATRLATRTARRPMSEIVDVVRRRSTEDAVPDEEPVFLLSAGWRSGSTLVQRLLMSTDELFVWGEPFDRSLPIQGLVAQARPITDDWPQSKYVYDGPSDHDERNLSEEWIANLSPGVGVLVDAQRAYLRSLLAAPDAVAGRRWGLKEVRLSGHDAVWLSHLFPGAKFVFLVRNPRDAYGSYKAIRRWFERWPTRMVTGPAAFGELWSRLAGSFLDVVDDVDGVLVRYEDVVSGAAIEKLEELLGVKIDRSILDVQRAGAQRWRPYRLRRRERRQLHAQVHAVAARLGYSV